MEVAIAIIKYIGFIFDDRPEIVFLASLSLSTFLLFWRISAKKISKLETTMENQHKEFRQDKRDLWKSVSAGGKELSAIKMRVEMHANHFDVLDKTHQHALDTAQKALETATDAKIECAQARVNLKDC